MSSSIFWTVLVGLSGLILAAALFVFRRRSSLSPQPASIGATPQNQPELKKAQSAKDRGQYAEAGELYEGQGQIQEAIGMYKKAGLYHHTARLYEKQRQWADAGAMYELNQNYEKAGRCYQQANNFVKAAQVFLRIGKKRLAAETYERGRCYREAAHIYEQEDQLQKAGEMYANLKEYGQAAQLFDKFYRQMKKEHLSVEEKEFLTGYAKRSGEFYLRSNNVQAAAKIYAEADLIPEAVSAYLQAGDTPKADQLALRLSDAGKVMEIYEKNGQKEKGPEIAAAIYQKENRPLEAAKLWERTGNLQKTAEALEQGQRFKEAAVVYEKLKDTSKAVALLEKAGELYEAAVLCQRLGRLDDAFGLFGQIAPESPLRAEALLMRGRISLQQGRLEQAREVYRQLVSSTSPSADLTPWYELALVTERLGDTKEAISLYEQILRNDAQYRDVKSRHTRLSNPPVRASSETTQITPPESSKGAEPVLANRYRLVRLVGRGGSGAVHEALDLVLNRTVAVKLLSEATGDNLKQIEDFLREARTAAILNHPNIVTIHDTGQAGSKYFIVMEYVDGESLKSHLETRLSLSLSDLLGLAKQACVGLDYAHRKGILHRDIKPGNLLVDREGTVKITDFGLARSAAEASHDTVVKGTPFYMSPEQIQGLKSDFRSDIYSFGCMLYRMIVKRPPFTQGDIYQQHLNSLPIPPSTVNPEIPEALNRIILKCLEKDREKRYPDVASLLRELQMVS
jgi:tetratricopeptide (TPR) repeat protein